MNKKGSSFSLKVFPPKRYSLLWCLIDLKKEFMQILTFILDRNFHNVRSIPPANTHPYSSYSQYGAGNNMMPSGGNAGGASASNNPDQQLLLQQMLNPNMMQAFLQAFQQQQQQQQQ